ncbi:MAG: hypothetical protein M3Y74_12125 [Chloroflexota bacterium]|nr:hypothetical protein [Chloroflexota bacterium]
MVRRGIMVMVMVVVAVMGALPSRASTALAATLTVCPSGCSYTVIQDAVNAAMDGDTVQVGAGTYTQTVTISTSLTLVGAGAGQTIIDGNNYTQHAPLVAITGTAGQVTLSGLTLQHGLGGGLLNNGQAGLEAARVVSSAIVANVNFRGGIGNGGGIDNEGGALTVISSTVAGNTAASNGGGLENGGAARLALVASTVSGNTAPSGVGGGIDDGGLNGSGLVTLTDSTVYSNTAADGGGLSIGGVGTLAVTDSTVYSNTAATGGGLDDTNSSAVVALTGTILAGNTAGQGPDCNTLAGGLLASGGYNLLGNGDSCQGLTNGAHGDQVGASNQLLDPRLGPLQDNGGPTQTLAPRADSTAIGAVPASACATTIDQRGVARPDPASGSPGYCTVGAVEYQAHPVTRHVAPAGRDSGDCTASPCQTIGYAVGLAGDFDTVAVAAGTYTEAVTITKPLAVDGAGAGQTIIDGGQSAATGAITAPLVTITGTAGQVTLSGLTLQHGSRGLVNAGRPGVETTHLIDSAITGNFANNGGGIDNTGGSVTVLRSTIANNLAATFGGGIANTGGSVGDTIEVISSTISGNSAIDGGFGGGIANTGSAAGAVRVVDSTLSGNTAGAGGAIYNVNAAGGGAKTGTVTIVDSTVYSNTASGSGIAGGGAIYNAGSLAVIASTIYSNTAGSGGGVYMFSGTAALTDTILAGNTARGGSGPDCSGTLTSGGYNLLGDNSGCAGPVNGQNGDQVGTPSAPIDPTLGPLRDNGGPTLTLALLPGSPAVDVIPSGACAVATDQRGVTRPANGGTGKMANGKPYCDVGAFERAATGPVTPPVPPATATPELGSGELLVTGLLPLGLALLARKRRARRMTQR